MQLLLLESMALRIRTWCMGRMMTFVPAASRKMGMFRSWPMVTEKLPWLLGTTLAKVAGARLRPCTVSVSKE